METLVRIIEIVAWPLTTIVLVMLLRSPLSELVPTLKKLKFKDLELEFEREAKKILAEAERDLPNIPEKPKPEKKDSGIFFSRRRLAPATEILESWRSLELDLRELAKVRNLPSGKSIRDTVSALESNHLIAKEVADIVLNLAALRNRVAHTNEEAISDEVASDFRRSVNRVRSALGATNA